MSELAVDKREVNAEQDVAEDEDALVMKRILRNRRNIKSFHTQASFFRFLFFEYKHIRNFGNVSHIFFPNIFPPGIQLSKDVCTTFTKYLQPWSVSIFKTTTHIIKTGWPYLNKKEYNLIVVLKKLCEKIVKTDFTILNYSDKNLINKLYSI